MPFILNGLGTKVMSASGDTPGWPPGIWSARSIGAKGSYGPEVMVNRNLSKTIRGNRFHKYSPGMTVPITGMMGVYGMSNTVLITRLAIGLAIAATLAALFRRKTAANPPTIRQAVDDNFWVVYWHQPGTKPEDATAIGTVTDKGHSLMAQTVRGETQHHGSFDDAEDWLIRKTWRIIPGGKR